MLIILFGFTFGFGMPFQTCMNTRLIDRVGTPFASSLASFSTGMVLLLAITFAVERTLVIPYSVLSLDDFWMFLGGCFAMVFVTSNILLMSRLGSVQTVILPAMGQIIMGSIIEQTGLFNSVGRDMNLLRIIGVIAVFAGVCIIVTARAGREEKRSGKNLWLYRLLGIAAGMCMASQTAVNSQLGLALDSRWFAAVTNFAVAIILLILANLFTIKKIRAAHKTKVPLSSWGGGIIGVFYVIANMTVGQTYGPGLAVVLVLTGMMAGSMVVDQFGLFSSPKRPVTVVKAGGLALMLAGALMFHLL